MILLHWTPWFPMLQPLRTLTSHNTLGFKKHSDSLPNINRDLLVIFVIYCNCNQGWGAGKFFSGSGFLSSRRAEEPANFYRLRLLTFFFQAAPAPAPRSQKHPAPTGSGCGSPALLDTNIFSFFFFFYTSAVLNNIFFLVIK